jgi:Sulfotransferase family
VSISLDGAKRRLILILSSERSGSTLTRVILGEHSRIVAPQELFLMRYPTFREWREQKSVAVESLVEFFQLIGQPHDVEWIDRQARDMSIHEAYAWMMSFIRPEQYLLDKTPAYANDGDILRRSVPLEPYFIWLIRHPLAVIESHLRLKFKEQHTRDVIGLGRKLRDQVVDQVARFSHGLLPMSRGREVKWVVQNLTIREFLSTVPTDRQCVIKFEELVRNPGATVEQLCQFLQLPVEDAMLDACGARKVMNVNLGDPNFHKHDKIDPATADIWKEFFTEDRLTMETRRLMDAIGVVRG